MAPLIIYNFSGAEIGRIELQAFPDDTFAVFTPRTGLTPEQAIRQLDDLLSTLKSKQRCNFCEQPPKYCQC